MTRYFVNQQGDYIGGFDGAEPPPNSIEIPAPPPLHAAQKRIGNGWGPPPPSPPPTPNNISLPALVDLLRQRGIIP